MSDRADGVIDFVDDPGAPLTYFEDAVSVTVTGGVAAIALTTRIGLPAGRGETAERHIAVCHLRCNRAALLSLALAVASAVEMCKRESAAEH